MEQRHYLFDDINRGGLTHKAKGIDNHVVSEVLLSFEFLLSFERDQRVLVVGNN